MTTHKVYVDTESLSKEELKELGMEKLIELLTEHCRKHYGFKDDDDIEIDTDSICFHLYHKGKRCFPIKIETVICKDFGFIKRLVDNDKIDFGKVKRVYKNKRVCNMTNATIDYIAYGKYESLLMLLSIQDNPIEFLVSII